MSPQTSPPSENTVLFLDVVNSTRLYEQSGDRKAFSLVTTCLSHASSVVLDRGGRVVKYTGDGLMAVFHGPDAAADSAIGIHLALHDCPSVADQSIGVRIGFHTGPLLKSGTDVFGETVNLASRVAALASAGRALTTSASVRAMTTGLRERLTAVPTRVLRGANQPVELYELRCEAGGETTSLLNIDTALQEHVELRLRHNQRWVVINHWKPALSIGRDPTQDLRVEDQRASRHHAEVQMRGDKFVLSDQSSNGTYVTIGNAPEFVLTREDAVLHGSGWISLGRSRADNPLAIEFFSA
ncbi:MAG: FHA domain-containing protein [Pseudazoarcus pumilus]|nr:FHA domain-containing protein [Pseudazoarcus pumilus]